MTSSSDVYVAHWSTWMEVRNVIKPRHRPLHLQHLWVYIPISSTSSSVFGELRSEFLAMAKLNPNFISLILIGLVAIATAEVIFEERFEGSYISLSIFCLDSVNAFMTPFAIAASIR